MYNILILIVYYISLLLSTTYQFQRHSGKNLLHGYMGKTDKVSPSSGFWITNLSHSLKHEGALGNID